MNRCLKRSFNTAEIAFGDKFPIIEDKRLRECDYGDLTGHSSDEIEPEMVNHIKVSFPNGESYEDTTLRIKKFLNDLKKNYEGKKVLIIGHRATRFGLENLINGVSLEVLTTTSFKWQPGWNYKLD